MLLPLAAAAPLSTTVYGWLVGAVGIVLAAAWWAYAVR